MATVFFLAVFFLIGIWISSGDDDDIQYF